jgi:hypothetical protein
LTLKTGQGSVAERKNRTIYTLAGMPVFKNRAINPRPSLRRFSVYAASREDSQQQEVENRAKPHFLLSCHCVTKPHLHTLIHDELRMSITFKCERAPCPDKESRSVCTGQAGLSLPSVPSYVSTFAASAGGWAYPLGY